jgi:hypothetical protein
MRRPKSPRLCWRCLTGSACKPARRGPGQLLAGYGGDIAPAGGGFAVSCPRANGVALWRADGQWMGFLPLQEACALAAALAPEGMKNG